MLGIALSPSLQAGPNCSPEALFVGRLLGIKAQPKRKVEARPYPKWLSRWTEIPSREKHFQGRRNNNLS